MQRVIGGDRRHRRRPPPGRALNGFVAPADGGVPPRRSGCAVSISLWVVAGVLAVVNLTVGLKLVVSRVRLAESMAWAGHFSGASVGAIGAFEVRAVGLILPGVRHVAPVLVPLAATGTVVLQLGASVVNIRYDEADHMPINLVLIGLAVFVAWGQFGPRPL